MARDLAAEGLPGDPLARVDEADRLRTEERDIVGGLRRLRGVAGALVVLAVSMGLPWKGGEGFSLVVFGTVAVLALWAVGVWGVTELRAPSRLQALRRRLDLLDGAGAVARGSSDGQPPRAV